MNFHSGAFLRDIRKIKKNSTVTLAMTTKDLTSLKDLGKTRSSDKINMNKLLDNKNEKIKSIDQKLDQHQNQIQKNNGIIEELTNNFMHLRGQFVKEKQRAENECRRNRLLKDEIQRTNKLLRNKTSRVEELNKKLIENQKQIENFRATSQKLEELSKANTSLRKTNNQLEETIQERKTLLHEKQKQNEKLKEELRLKSLTHHENEKYKLMIQEKDAQIYEINLLRERLENENKKCKELNELIDKKLTEIKDRIDHSEKRLVEKERQLKILKESEHILKEKLNKTEKEKEDLKSQIHHKDNTEEIFKNQISTLRKKYEETSQLLKNKNYEEKQKFHQLKVQQDKINQLKKMLSQSQNGLLEMRQGQNRLELLQKKSKTLDQLYQAIVPQVQCPFGHELKNPVTIIPCGHNYCLGCKRGYTKDCSQCNGKLKIEAVYRNELMDDIIGMINGIKQVLEIIK